MLRGFLVLLIVVTLIVPGALWVGAQEEAPQPMGFRPDAPPYGVRGPHPVGAMAFSTGDAKRPLAGMIWYPALNPDGAEEVISYDFGLGDIFPPELNNPPGRAILDAAADLEGGPYPLVIFSHGGGWVWQLSTFLLEHLASHGFVVMAFYHPGTSWPDQLPIQSDEEYAAFFEGVFDGFVIRSGDITRAIDYAEAVTGGDGLLAGAVDADHVAIMGHSYGGNTALMAAGARLDFSPAVEWCKLDVFATESMMVLCSLYGEDTAPLETRLMALVSADIQPGDLFPAVGDPRVDAIVPIMPGPIYPVLGGEGLASVTVPMLLFQGSADTSGVNEFCGDVVWADVGSTSKTRVIFQGADHLLASTGCSAAWQEMCFFCCADPVWDVDRAHDLIDHFTTAFLLAVLKDDAEAAAALAPDAVQFPGIAYETTSFQ